MKKNLTVVIVVLLMSVLFTSCGNTNEADSLNNVNKIDNPTSTSRLTLDYENALNVDQQLALGIVKLDETEYPVEREQASTLLPLWKAIKSLSDSEIAAEEEINALFGQIEGELTDEQIAAIVEMQLTNQDMRAITQEMGLSFGNGAGKFENLSPEQQATAKAMRESGQSPQGGSSEIVPGQTGGPGGGLGRQGLAGEGIPPSGEASARIKGAITGVNPFILDAVISFLEGKVNG